MDGRRIDKLTTGATQSSFGSKLYRVHGGLTNEKVGLGIVLKVMAGDQVKITAESYYTMPGGGPGTPTGTAALSELLSAFVGGSAVSSTHTGLTTTDVSSIGTNSTSITSFLNGNSEGSNNARAFLNYLLFDDQMKFVSGGADPVNVGGGYKQHTAFVSSPVSVSKSGYIYVYVSNESNFPVYFDNLAVTHTPGAILESNSYYPFGLVMQGISSKAMAFGSPENKKKFVGQEFDDDLGWDTYQFRFRTHDPQIGRFLQVDPLADKYVYNSTYAYAENKPINGIDLEGKEWWGMFFAENNSVISRGPLLEEAVKTTSETSAKTPKIEEHHIIPRQLGDNPVMETAKKGGFELQKSPGENTMPLEKFSKATGEGQHGNAPKYTAEVLKRIAEFQEKNPGASPEKAAQFARDLVKNLKETINNNPTTKLNDLFKSATPLPTDNTGKKAGPMVDVQKLEYEQKMKKLEKSGLML